MYVSILSILDRIHPERRRRAQAKGIQVIYLGHIPRAQKGRTVGTGTGEKVPEWVLVADGEGLPGLSLWRMRNLPGRFSICSHSQWPGIISGSEGDNTWTPGAPGMSMEALGRRLERHQEVLLVEESVGPEDVRWWGRMRAWFPGDNQPQLQ